MRRPRGRFTRLLTVGLRGEDLGEEPLEAVDAGEEAAVGPVVRRGGGEGGLGGGAGVRRVREVDHADVDALELVGAGVRGPRAPRARVGRARALAPRLRRRRRAVRLRRAAPRLARRRRVRHPTDEIRTHTSGGQFSYTQH